MTEAPTKWWQSFFRDVVVDMWLRAVPEEYTRTEIDFIRTMLQVSPPARLLDGPCGGGRHAIPLAAAGYRVTGVDVSPDFLAAARARSEQEKLSIRWIESGMRDLSLQKEFDGALCFVKTFGSDDD